MNKAVLVVRWILFLLLLASFASCKTSCSSSVGVPHLVAGPGMTLDEVKAQSTVHLGTYESAAGRGVSQPSEPHDVLFHGLGPDVSLPEGRFTVLSTVKTPRGATVEGMVMTPVMDYLNYDEALAFADVLGARFMAAGWTVKRRWARSDILGSMKGPDRASGASVVFLAFGRYRVLIELTRGARGDSELGSILGLNGDGVLVTVRVHDDQFEVDKDKK